MRESFSFSVLVALCGTALTVSLAARHHAFVSHQWNNVFHTNPSPIVAVPATQTSRLAFVTDGTSDYWRSVHQGIQKAEKETGVKVDFRMASQGTLYEQHEALAEIVDEGVQGITVVPASPDSESALLNKTSDRAALFTAATDVPQSKRDCFLGTTSSIVSSQIARELQVALPRGGEVLVLAGLTDLQTTNERVTELKAELVESKIRVIDSYANHSSDNRNDVSGTLSQHPHLKAVVSLGGPSSSAILKALANAQRKHQVKVICTDADQATLDGIKHGTITATIVPSPTELGYLSTLNMTRHLSGDQSVIPSDHQIFVPTQIFDKSNVNTLSASTSEF